MNEVVRLDQAPPPATPPTRRRGLLALGLVAVLAVVAVGLLDAQSQHREQAREQHRQEAATAFSVSVNPDGYSRRTSDLTLSVTLRNDGPVPVIVRQIRIDELRSGPVPLVLSPGAEKAVDLTGTVDCTGPVPSTALVAVSLPSGDRTVATNLSADLGGLCVAQGEALLATAGPPEPIDDGLSVPLTIENTGLQQLRLIAVRVRSTTATVSAYDTVGEPDPASFIALAPGSRTVLKLQIATPPSCRDLAAFLDAPVAVLRYDSGRGTVVASLPVRIDRTALPDPHDVCG